MEVLKSSEIKQRPVLVSPGRYRVSKIEDQQPVLSGELMEYGAILVVRNETSGVSVMMNFPYIVYEISLPYRLISTIECCVSETSETKNASISGTPNKLSATLFCGKNESIITKIEQALNSLGITNRLIVKEEDPNLSIHVVSYDSSNNSSIHTSETVLDKTQRLANLLFILSSRLMNEVESGIATDHGDSKEYPVDKFGILKHE